VLSLVTLASRVLMATPGHLQLIFISLHSCALLLLLFFLSLAPALPSIGPVLLSPSVAIWLAWMKLSVWRLELLASSSVVSATLGGAELAISLGPTLRDKRSAFCLCSSSSTCSTGMASSMFSVAVGRMARTVKVQSSWFCSKRRRRLDSG
jgi:hypothetical protein